MKNDTDTEIWDRAAHWQRVKDVFHAALQEEPADRRAYLQQACDGDQILQREVERLIAHDGLDGSFLDNPVVEEAALLLILEGRSDAPGNNIGPYRLLREIGHGGMGTVYLAERADKQYQKRVAIKLVRPGISDEDILDRFRHERQILAALDHPNIAKLLEGGTSEDGLPYFVMEFIEGAPSMSIVIQPGSRSSKDSSCFAQFVPQPNTLTAIWSSTGTSSPVTF